MRLLHTSDWHLGRQFHGHSLLEAQAAFIDHLVNAVSSEGIEVVLVAGDVFDRALPGIDAIALADEAYRRIRAAGARLVVSSGNHDSAIRLGQHSQLIDAAGVHVRTDPERLDEPILVGPEIAPTGIYAVPYLEPDLLREPWGLPARSHQAAMAEATRRIRQDAAARNLAHTVVLAHAFVAGGVPSDSERDISVGGVSVVGLDLFDGFDYVALGHLHGRAALTESVRYSGSPVAYSFSEANHVKGSWIIDLVVGRSPEVSFLQAPVPRPLRILRGTLSELLTDPTLGDAEEAWVQATLTDAERPAQAMSRLQHRFPHTVALRFEHQVDQPVVEAGPPSGLSDHALTLEFVKAVRGRPATPAESELLEAACEAAPFDPDADRASA